MPLISSDTTHSTKEQKEKLSAGSTEIADEILGIDVKYFYVVFKENDRDNRGVVVKNLAEFLAEQKK